MQKANISPIDLTACKHAAKSLSQMEPDKKQMEETWKSLLSHPPPILKKGLYL